MYIEIKWINWIKRLTIEGKHRFRKTVQELPTVDTVHMTKLQPRVNSQ